MNCTIGQILHVCLLYKDQEHWPDYVAITKMAISSTINANINKVPLDVLYDENIPLPWDLLLSRESCISPHAHTFANKMKLLIKKVKSAIHNA